MILLFIPDIFILNFTLSDNILIFIFFYSFSIVCVCAYHMCFFMHVETRSQAQPCSWSGSCVFVSLFYYVYMGLCTHAAILKAQSHEPGVSGGCEPSDMPTSPLPPSTLPSSSSSLRQSLIDFGLADQVRLANQQVPGVLLFLLP